MQAGPLLEPGFSECRGYTTVASTLTTGPSALLCRTTNSTLPTLYLSSASPYLHLSRPERRLLHIGVGQRERMDSTLEAEIDRLSRPPGDKASGSEPTILQPQNGRLAEGSTSQAPGQPQQQRLSRNSSAGSNSGGSLRSPHRPGLAAGRSMAGYSRVAQHYLPQSSFCFVQGLPGAPRRLCVCAGKSNLVPGAIL